MYHTQLSMVNLSTNEHINLKKYHYFFPKKANGKRHFKNPWFKGILGNLNARMNPSENSYVLPLEHQGLLEKADEMGVTLGITRAVVSGGALFPSLRDWYAARNISCLQCYATADLGLIAYESEAMEGMIVDEGVIVEIVTPGTGDPVPVGDVGEVVVTSLNPDYPLIRFATGDLSAVMPGHSPCGRTKMRIKGWMGRADQTTKIKGMFVRPEQVAALVERHDAVDRVRVVATRDGERDQMVVKVEGEGVDVDAVEDSLRDVLKLSGTVEAVPPGDLPRDGVVIEDARTYD